jgi:hypothetical protein
MTGDNGLIWVLLVLLAAGLIAMWLIQSARIAALEVRAGDLEVRVLGLEKWVGEVNAAINRVMSWFGIK